MKPYTPEYFKTQVTEFRQHLGLRKSWEGELGDRIIDRALRGLSYVYLNLECGPDLEKCSCQMDVCLREFDARDALTARVGL